MKWIKTNEYNFGNPQIRDNIRTKRESLRVKYKSLHSESLRIKRIKIEEKYKKKVNKILDEDKHLTEDDIDSDDSDVYVESDDEIMIEGSFSKFDLNETTISSEMNALLNPMIGTILKESGPNGEKRNLLSVTMDNGITDNKTVPISQEIIELQDRLRIIDKEDSMFSDTKEYWLRKVKNQKERTQLIDEIRQLSQSNKLLEAKKIRRWFEDFALMVYTEYNYCKELDHKIEMKRMAEIIKQRENDDRRQKQLTHILTMESKSRKRRKIKKKWWKVYEIPKISIDQLQQYHSTPKETPLAKYPINFRMKTKLLRNWVSSVLLYLSSGIITSGLYWTKVEFFTEFKKLLWFET
jgi:hypothetical protein